VIALALCLPITARGAKRQLTPPPMGEDITVKVMRGGSIDIQLRAHEGRGNPLAYEIVREPQSGRLEGFRQADRNRQGSASIVYVHGDDEESIEDEFAFRARGLIGGGVSSPIKVKLRIVDAPPRLGIAPVVDFSAVAGESDVQQLILANEGGGLLEGSIEPAEPFHVEGDGRFSLGRGQSTGLLIRFSPQSTDSIPPQKLSPAPADPGTSVTLKGEAKAPFSASAEPMELGPDGSRTGKVSVANLSTSPLALRFETEPKDTANVPETVQVPAGGMSEIPVTIGTEKKGGAVGLQIRISSTHYEQELVVEAPAVPPKLEVGTKELDFLQTDEAEVLVRNAGGVEGEFSLDLPKGIQSLAGAESFRVPPDSETRVLLRLENKKDANAGESLIVDLRKDGKVRVPLLFPSPTPSPTPFTTPQPPDTPAQDPPKPWKLNKDVKLKTGPDGPIIAWISAKSQWTNAQVEVIDEKGPRIYREEPARKNWWETAVEWWFGQAAETTKAVQEKLENRLRVPGEDSPAADTNERKEPEWKELKVSSQDATNAMFRWRIVAQGKAGNMMQVSDEFRLASGELAKAPVAAPPTTTEPESRGELPREIRKHRKVFSRAQPITPKAWSPAKDGATIIFEMPLDVAVRDYRFERMQRLFGLDPATGHPCITYEGKPFLEGSAEILDRQSSMRDGKRRDEITVRFSGMRAGTEVYWRVVPLAEGGGELPPSEPLHFWTLPPWRFPWTSAALAACTIFLAVLVFMRWKSRRSAR